MKKIIYIGACIFAFGACNTDTEIYETKESILGNPNYNFEYQDIPVEVQNKKITSVQTNAQRMLFLGQITQGDFGVSNASIVSQVSLPTPAPTFGILSQEKEQEASSYSENETVESVYLYLPFYSTSTQKLDTNNQTITEYKLDSIFGDVNANFDIKVEQLTYFLSEVDVNLKSQPYFSDENLTTGAILAQRATQINKNVIVRHNFDDPATSADESTTEKDKLAPGIRLELDRNFFQTHLLDKEGSDELKTQAAFRNHIRGLIISATNFSADLLAYINLSNAKIEVNYAYTHRQGVDIYTKKMTYELALSGIGFNKYENTGDVVSLSTDAIYLKGGLGYVAEVSLSATEIQRLKDRKALITGADLILYVDASRVNTLQKQPSYLLPYIAETGTMLTDYSLDVINGQQTLPSISKLEKDEQGNYFYKLKIADYLSFIIEGKIQNKPIGFGVALDKGSASSTNTTYVNPNITAVTYRDTSSQEGKTLSGVANNLLHTILHGSTSADVSKRPKIRLYYANQR